ncbi:cobalamin B12-binding domain-containing protein [Rhodovulum adriaticum]|uniref:B12 binding protein n=1 Tax=Rhodovulum adriaticum TaxID=35804 RepID=A0A4R2P1B2_RHOAD|nr:cobalamin B12-binding domain-containing protein [Rhodovulum adriaticum]TCP27714.1 B12 binding protein [Rhodovulum adriaticum]
MADTQRRVSPAADDAVHHGEVESLATQVLSALAHRAAPGLQGVDGAVLTDFCADLLRGGTAIRTDSLSALRGNGVGPEVILDCYIPAAARELGDRWTRDELGFADVTIATARLQAMLREMGEPSDVEITAGPDAPNVMLIVPVEEYHTLGGMMAANQMRRLGLSVCLCLGQGDDELQQKAASRQFDMIAFSVSCMHKLDAVRRLVALLRRATQGRVPLVVGGHVVEGPGAARQICAQTGADHATADPKEALRMCGLQAPALAGAGKTARHDER